MQASAVAGARIVAGGGMHKGGVGGAGGSGQFDSASGSYPDAPIELSCCRLRSEARGVASRRMADGERGMGDGENATAAEADGMLSSGEALLRVHPCTSRVPSRGMRRARRGPGSVGPRGESPGMRAMCNVHAVGGSVGVVAYVCAACGEWRRVGQPMRWGARSRKRSARWSGRRAIELGPMSRVEDEDTGERAHTGMVQTRSAGNRRDEQPRAGGCGFFSTMHARLGAAAQS